VNAVIEIVQPTGSRSYATFDLGGQPMLAELQAHDVSRPGETIPIDLNLNRASLFDPATGRAI
jgi:multiple sugar transport system ATP-binding protein